MADIRLTAGPGGPADLVAGFAAIRAEMKIPPAFPEEVERAAEAAAAAGPAEARRSDLRDVPFVTVDPPTSRDLDQALAIEADGRGFVLRYAIADVGAFVPRDSIIEREAWRRGVTIYSPDLRTPLYPTSLSEGAASLLPDETRPAFVFTIAVDSAGAAHLTGFERALVRSRAKLAYSDATAERLPGLQDLGELLAAAAHARGAGGLEVPTQELRADGGPLGFTLGLESRLPQEDWNAQLSLAANATAAQTMSAAGVGLFREMAPPAPERLAQMATVARALGLDLASPPKALGDLDAARGPAVARASLLRSARHAMGAHYRAIPPVEAPAFHIAVAGPYAHATAPLRRLADRYVLELVLELREGRQPTPAHAAAIAELPRVMDRAQGRAERLESAAIDLAEAWYLHPRIGESFAAVVTDVKADGARIQLRELPVRSRVQEAPGVTIGELVTARLVEADPAGRRVRFELA